VREEKKKPVWYLLFWRSSKVKCHKLAANNILMGEGEGRKAKLMRDGMNPPHFTKGYAELISCT